MATLIIHQHDRELQRIPILQVETLVGREPSCDVALNSSGVSRHHAVIQYSDSGFAVTDLGSSNGITVNGIRTPSAPLTHGSVIRVPGYSITFVEDGGPPVEKLIIGPVRAKIPNRGTTTKHLPGLYVEKLRVIMDAREEDKASYSRRERAYMNTNHTLWIVVLVFGLIIMGLTGMVFFLLFS